MICIHAARRWSRRVSAVATNLKRVAGKNPQEPSCLRANERISGSAGLDDLGRALIEQAIGHGDGVQVRSDIG